MTQPFLHEAGAELGSNMFLAGGATAVGVNTPGLASPGALEVYDGQGCLVLRYEPELGQVRLGLSSAT